MDANVGRKIRDRRRVLGLSLQDFAGMIGVACQQARTYELGMNRVSAGRLYGISQALTVPLAWFFEGFDAHLQDVSAMSYPHDPELARTFATIDSDRHCDALAQMARALAAQSLRRRNGTG